MQPVDVADLTLKVDGLAEKILYYGFAEGDQIVFNFSEVGNILQCYGGNTTISLRFVRFSQAHHSPHHQSFGF